MGGIFSAPKLPAPAAPPAPPKQSDAGVQERAAAERKRIASMKGRASTILTGGQGVVGGDAQVAKKTLLGE